MTNTKPDRRDEQVKLRVSPEMKFALEHRAKVAMRSMNAEIVAILENAIADAGESERLNRRIAALEEAVFGPTGRNSRQAAA